MYPGWIATGTGSPFAGGVWTELVNNGRAYTYARQGGINWLQECDTCPDTDTVVPGSPRDGYVSPELDPAPWYDPDNPDSSGFFGVIGLEVTGDENSTRTAAVSLATTGGGIIGPPYYGPRTLVLRALVIAGDECSLQFGLNWLREQSAQQLTPCGGDSITYFDCCPCMCEGSGAGGPCWPDNYGELTSGPDCDLDWWPASYGELKVGPPESSDDWCSWPEWYFELLGDGPTDRACCLNQCIYPYLRQYHNTMVTEGPTILNHPAMTVGAMAEVELTITAADPVEYALSVTAGAGTVRDGGAPIPGSGVVSVGAAVNTIDSDPPDPFDVGPRWPTHARRPRVPAPKGGWERHEQVASASAFGKILNRQRLSLRLRNGDDSAEQVRIGVWDGDERVAGYLIPFVPPRARLTIDAARRIVEGEFDTRSRALNGFVRDWDGGAPRFPDLPHGSYRVTVDQEAGKGVRMIVGASATPVGVG